MNTIYEAIIIGAGPSGLMTLKEFQRKKLIVLRLRKPLKSVGYGADFLTGKISSQEKKIGA